MTDDYGGHDDIDIDGDDGDDCDDDDDDDDADDDG